MRLVALLAMVAGCFHAPTGDQAAIWDVRGNYALSYDDRLALDLTVGGAVRHSSSSGHDVVDFGTIGGQSLKLDLAAFCARPDVICPSEALAPRVSIDQRDFDKDQPQHLIDVVGESQIHYGGIVDHTKQEEFVVPLGGQAAFDPSCVALSLSIAIGRFTHRGETVTQAPMWRSSDGGACEPTLDGGAGDCSLSTVPGGVVWPGDAPVDGIAGGQITTAWLGACAFAGLAADATLKISTGFVGSRTGDYAPPTPFDAAVEVDAGPDASSSD